MLKKLVVCCEPCVYNPHCCCFLRLFIFHFCIVRLTALHCIWATATVPVPAVAKRQVRRCVWLVLNSHRPPELSRFRRRRDWIGQCRERVQTSNSLSATVLSRGESNPIHTADAKRDSFVASGRAVWIEHYPTFYFLLSFCSLFDRTVLLKHPRSADGYGQPSRLCLLSFSVSHIQTNFRTEYISRIHA